MPNHNPRHSHDLSLGEFLFNVIVIMAVLGAVYWGLAK